MRLLSVLVIMGLVPALFCTATYADSITVLKQGLIGAGTGAVATAMSGAKGDAVWKGALAGAGITVVGGALLDMLTGEQVGTVTYVREAPLTYARQAQPATAAMPMWRGRQYSASQRIYRDGFRNGYRQGYRDGYENAANDMSSEAFYNSGRFRAIRRF